MKDLPRPNPTQAKPAHCAGKLFLSFLKLGLTAFGGPAMVAYIHELAVKKNNWLSEESFQQGVAICQIIPGATAMQVAAYVGLRSGGPFGALAAYVGFGLPAFLLMVVLAVVYQNGHDHAAIVAIFRGLQVIVIALVANAALNFGRSTIRNWQDILLGSGVTVFLVMQGSPLIAISASCLLAILLYNTVVTTGKNSHLPTAVTTLADLSTPLVLTLALCTGMLAVYCYDRRLFDLSLVMVRVDLFAFGGGYGSIPLMFNEVVNVRHWLDAKTFMNGIALGQVTPGPIVITATFVGYVMALLPGALIGTIAIFSPSFILLTAVVPYFDRLQRNIFFQRGMRGVLVSFVGLLLSVTMRFVLAVQWDLSLLFFLIIAFLALRLKVDILWVVLAGAALSALVL